ncbi:MAG: hypothetical protein R3336_05170 [Phycisphaeraceae bacterium]|nr:hypothetical protein [Phycisphaeraceae bacterium]
MCEERTVNTKHCTDRIRVDYAHVGLFDAREKKFWIAKKRWGVTPVRVSHAKMLVGGGQDTSTADKDRFLCYWFHTPDTGSGYVQGYPIEWDEGHLLVRFDPNWDYINQKFIANAHRRKIEKNLDQQFDWGKKIFEAYAAKNPDFPISYHMVGPRPADSMFYVERIE